MTQLSINIAGVVTESITDGPGIRYTLFCQGCPHECPGCHNPETWAFEEKERILVEELLKEIQKYPLVKGVTISGGEPFSQAAACAALAKMLKEKGYEVAVYTGYTFEELFFSEDGSQHNLLSYTDILIDGRFEEAERNLSLWFRGSENQRVLNIPESLSEKKAVRCTESRWVGEEDN